MYDGFSKSTTQSFIAIVTFRTDPSPSSSQNTSAREGRNNQGAMGQSQPQLPVLDLQHRHELQQGRHLYFQLLDSLPQIFHRSSVPALNKNYNLTIHEKRILGGCFCDL